MMFHRLFLLASLATAAWCDTRSLPIAFEPNRGQAPAEFNFVSRSGQYGLSLSPARVEWVSGASRVSAFLEGAQGNASVQSEDPMRGVVNYVRGSNPAAWLLDIPTYGRVRYQSIYPGIDIVYYGKDGRLEYDFVVAPHARPERIRIRYDGARRVRLDADGNLLLETGTGTLVQHKPVAYQETSGRRQLVEARYVVSGDRVHLQLARYDRSRPLVIDPTLTWATYSSFHSTSSAISSVATDAAGNIYVTGNQVSPLADTDCMVAELDPKGTTLIFKTLLAGSGDDAGYAITLDALGNIYATGQTGSNDFPVVGSNPVPAGLGVDAFVAKLDHTGKILYSTYLGGSLTDVGYGLALDISDDLYVTGGTQSTDFPRTGNAYQATLGGGIDAFLTVFDPTGKMIYSTFLGGSGDDVGYGVAIDVGYNEYITGSTKSTNFPVTAAAVQPQNAGGIDVFVTKLAPFGGPIYSTYIGGSGDDVPVGIAVDSFGLAYVGGDTSSNNFPTSVGAYKTLSQGRGDLFAFKLQAAGNQLAYATYVGGAGADNASGISLDTNGVLYIGGNSNSPNFPLVNAFQTALKGTLNGVVAAVSPNGTSLQFSSYLGGSAQDTASALSFNCASGLAVGGTTTSIDFPVTSGTLQTSFGLNSQDSFVANIGGFAPILPAVSSGGVQNGATFLPTPVAPGSVVTIKGSNLAGVIAAAQSFPLGTSMSGVTVSVNGTPAPLFYVSPTQINIQLPYEVAPGTAALSVNSCGGTSPVASFTVAPAAPYILIAGNGTALIQNPDYTLNTPAQPAHPGDTVMVYLIGAGALDNPIPDGVAAPMNVLSRATADHSATIGGQPASIYFLGMTPGFVGLAQANVTIPSLPSGQYALTLTVGGVASNTVQLNVQ